MKKKHTIPKTFLTYKTIDRFEAEYVTDQYTASEIEKIELAAYIANMREGAHPEFTLNDTFNDFLRILKIHKIVVVKKKTENPCSYCKYFTVCGDLDRTKPCNGKDVVKPFKLRVYDASGVFDHEEFFETKTGMQDRYIELSELSMKFDHIENLPTAWKLENGEWVRLSGY